MACETDHARPLSSVTISAFPLVFAQAWVHMITLARNQLIPLYRCAVLAEYTPVRCYKVSVFIPWCAGINVVGLTPEIAEPLPSRNGGAGQSISSPAEVPAAQIAQ